MDVTLGLDKGFTGAEAVATGDHGHHVLVLARRLHFDLALTAVCMAHFDHAGKLGRVQQLQTVREKGAPSVLRRQKTCLLVVTSAAA